jgi:DNA-binding protein H-NS
MKAEDDAYPPEKLAALRTVRKLVEFWQIRPQELRGPPPPPPPPPAGPAAIRYRHPVSGETWDGQGEHPQWLRDALLKEGYTVDALKRAVVDTPSANPGADAPAEFPDPAAAGADDAEARR